MKNAIDLNNAFGSEKASFIISQNLSDFSEIGHITEREIDVETDETVMVNIYQHKQTGKIYVRVYETDEVVECSDIQTAQKIATEKAYEFLTTNE